MGSERLCLGEVKNENDAREFVASKLIDIAMAVGGKISKKDINNRNIAYKVVSQHIRENYGIDTTPYDSLAIKLIKGTF